MTVIDTHCHAARSWYEPIEMLRTQMDCTGVDGAVLIQHNRMYDNSYLLDVKSDHPDRFEVVVQIDPDDPQPVDTFERLVADGAAGIRVPPGSPLLEHDGLWSRVNELRIPISAQGEPSDYLTPEFERLLDACPDVPVILEHLAGLGLAVEPFADVRSRYEAVLEHAERSNTYAKVPGLGEFCPKPMKLQRDFRMPDIPPAVDLAVEAFGPERLMWGSDYPPCSRREGYANTLRGVTDLLDLDRSQLDWIMGSTALELWDLG